MYANKRIKMPAMNPGSENKWCGKQVSIFKLRYNRRDYVKLITVYNLVTASVV
jgi:hypothetical protein